MPVLSDTVGSGGAQFGGAGTVVFTPGGGQVDSDLVLEWDFDNDGDFSESVEDITSYLYDVDTKTGRDFPSSVVGLAGPGALRANLRNDSNDFNFFNSASPMNQGSNSLRTGRKLRLRTAEAVDVDPALLLRDRFTTDGVLMTSETGQTWTTQNVGPGSDAWTVSDGSARPNAASGAANYATADVGVDDHYVQGTFGQLDVNQTASVVARYTDPNDLVFVRVSNEDGLELVEVVSGVSTVLGTYAVTPWVGMVVGLGVQGDQATAYVGGAPVLTDTLASPSGGTQAGIRAFWNSLAAQAPSFRDVYVFEDLSQAVEGVLWTGDVSDVRPSAPVLGRKTASVSGEGWLARAALAEVAAPRLPLEGAPTGVLVGDVLSKAELLHPPGAIAEGTVTTGPVGIPDGRALALARQFEETEIGLLYETNEGPLGYLDRTLTGSAPLATFSDGASPGLGFEEITPYDQRRAIINRVTAGVAPSAPSGIVADPFATHGAGGDVDITLPSVQAGDLLVVVISSSKGVDGNGVDWFVPRFWTEHRNLKTTVGMRIYSHVCDGTESATTVKFFDDLGTIAGLWVATLWRIRGWYGTTQGGLFVGDVVAGFNPAGIAHGWGRQPTLFMVFAAAIGSLSGGDYASTFIPPTGYQLFPGAPGAFITSGPGQTQYDAGWAAAYKIDCTEAEDPGVITALTGFTISESVVVAVRGYDGPLSKATGPVPGQPAGRFITVDDPASQLEQRVVRSHAAASNLFANEEDASDYAEAVLERHADDHPVFSMTFNATLSAAHRAQATRRRVGDVIHLDATGASGMGVEGDFVIESINHRVTEAGKLWRVTWELSQA